MYASQESYRYKIFGESRVEDIPLKNQQTLSTLSSPIVGKLKEQSSTEGSGVLLKNRQELSSSEELEPAVAGKLERTKDRT